MFFGCVGAWDRADLGSLVCWFGAVAVAAAVVVGVDSENNLAEAEEAVVDVETMNWAGESRLVLEASPGGEEGEVATVDVDADENGKVEGQAGTSETGGGGKQGMMKK